ncbi:DUF2059 domain-containing protein [Maridesulfovibrio sp. FT414]|uniref:DUF2059 domain-containing protein n=1 Tax=Maridesulfovibrio sp. FT414 TaxID=2979469 RepID=UPI003D803416
MTTLLAISAITAFALNVSAQNSNHASTKAAYEVIKYTNDLYEDMDLIGKMTNVMGAQIFEANPKTAPYRDVLSQALKEALLESWQDPEFQKERNAIMASVYAEIFSEKELKEISDFYKTETGQKYLKLKPLAKELTDERLQPITMKLLAPVINRNIAAKFAQLRHEGKIP